jgi:hypothetical protein
MKKSTKFEISYEKEEYFRGRDKKVLEISFKTNMHKGGGVKTFGVGCHIKKVIRKGQAKSRFYLEKFF